MAATVRAAAVLVAAAAARVAPVVRSSQDQVPYEPVAAVVVAQPGVVAAVALQHVHPAVAVELVSLHVQPAAHLGVALSAVAALADDAAPAQHVAARVEYRPVVVDQHRAAAAAVQPEQALPMFAVQRLYPDPGARP